MKKGLMTTEFWVMVLTTLGSVAASFEQILEPKYAAVIGMMGSIAYSLSRGLAKSSGK